MGCICDTNIKKDGKNEFAFVREEVIPDKNQPKVKFTPSEKVIRIHTDKESEMTNNDTVDNQMDKATNIAEAKGGLNHSSKSDQQELNKQQSSPESDTPSSEFKLQIFEIINQLRTDPKNFSKIIEKFLEYITTDSNGKFVINKNNSILAEINLKKGPQAFYETISSLQGIYPLEPLIYKEELEILLEDSDYSNWTKRSYITKLLEKKSNELKKKYSGFGFHFDTNIKDPELALVIQVVDDGSIHGQRRSNILSHQYKYVGVSHSDINSKERFCVFLNFAY